MSDESNCEPTIDESELLMELFGEPEVSDREADSEQPNTTYFGYPFPPNDFSSLPIEEVRRWGREAIDALANVDLQSADPQGVDYRWIIEAECWARDVLDAVSERLGTTDEELRRYAGEVFQRTNEEIRSMLEELGVDEEQEKPETRRRKDAPPLDWRTLGF